MLTAVMSTKEVTEEVKDVCIRAMQDEHSRTNEAPRYAVMAKELVTKHSWAHAPSLLRIKMRGWWETRCGEGKKRKAARRKEEAVMAQRAPAKPEQECLLTSCAIQLRAHAVIVEQARQEWATELLQQFNQPKTNYVNVYNLKGPAEIARAQDEFRKQCMVFWKKFRPVMPQRVEICSEARAVLRWWRNNRHATGEADVDFQNLCDTPDPKKKKQGTEYKNLSQQTLFACTQQSAGTVIDDYIIILPQSVARDAGPTKVPHITSPPPFVSMSGRDFWNTKVNGDERACVAATGFCSETCEKLWETYGRNMYIDSRNVLWAVLSVLKKGALQNTWQTLFPELGGRTTARQVITEAFDFLAAAVSELDPELRFSPYNHTPHFPPCVTCLCDVVPVGSIAGAFKKEMFSGYYHETVYKVLVVTDLLGRILAWSGPSFGSVADITVFRSFSKRAFPMKPWEVMLADGSFQGLPNVIVPYRKPAKGTLSSHDASYNTVHQMDRARVEHLFAKLWPFGLMKNIWQGEAATLTKRLRVLLHFVNFNIKRGFAYRPLGTSRA